MSREQNVPLLLWISTAILAHIATGGGADQVARVLEDRSELRSFALAARSRLQPSPNLEVSLESMTPATPPAPEPTQQPPAPRAPKPKKELAKEAIQPKKEPEKKLESKPIVLPQVAATTPPPTPPTPANNRIAVKQHAAPEQEDNPTAHFIADEANHVAEESVAHITSHDQDDPNPTPGGHHSGPAGVGNGEREKVAESEDHAGDPTRAPGESAQKADTEHQRAATPPNAGDPAQSAPKGERPSPQLAYTRGPTVAAPPALAAPPSGGANPAAEAIASEDGNYRVDPTRPGGPGPQPTGIAGPGKLPPAPVPSSPIGMLGLGGSPTPGGVNLNLTVDSVVAVVGQDKLNRERLADGERRKSAHRGSWQSSGFERWRSAIENYVSTVKPGNQTALNAARSPFATYLNTVHNRIHPIFADDFLGSLDGLPTNHPLNDGTLMARLEFVIDQADGHVVKLGVVRTSGITAFDVAALDSVQRASPFGKPPKAIVSPDGNVYFHWEFHRDPLLACSTMKASPFIVNTPPATPSPPAPSPKPTFPGGDPREQQGPPPPGSRQGLIKPALSGVSRRSG